MTTLYPCPPARLYFHDGNGHPLVGGTLSTYINNSTTPIQTYRDGLGMVKNPATITLDDRGEARVFLDPRIAYRLVVRDALGAVVLEQDGIRIPEGEGGGGGTVSVNVKSDDGSVAVNSSLDGDTIVFDISVKSFVESEVKKETDARKEADKSLSDDIGVISKSLLTETSERKAADEELAKAIGGKQGTLKDGDNIHIDDALKVNVVNRRTLMTKSPLTAEKLDTALVIGIRDGAFATPEAIETEAEARKTGDEQNRQRIDKVDADLNSEILNRIEAVSKKQDKYYVFDSSTSTNKDVQEAITDGRTIVSFSGSNFVTWQGTIHGGYPTLTRLEEGWQYSWNYSGGKWEYTAKKFDYGTNSAEYNPGVPNPTVVTGPFTATKNIRNTRLLDADGGLIGYLIESLGESGNVLLSSGNSVYWGDAPKEIPGYTKIAYPTSNQTPGDVLFTMGKFNVCGYMDNGGTLRLCVVPTDGETHSVSTNGKKGTCGADGLDVATSFYNSSPYMKLFIVDNNSFDVCEAEIYAITGARIAASSILYRVITDQTTGGSNG